MDFWVDMNDLSGNVVYYLLGIEQLHHGLPALHRIAT
jgi:hypothetical protein